MSLNYNLQGSENLKWKRDDTIIFYRRRETITPKVTEGMEVYKNGSFQLTNLKKKDTGRYTPEVHDTNGKAAEGLKPIYLCILGR